MFDYGKSYKTEKVPVTSQISRGKYENKGQLQLVDSQQNYFLRKIDSRCESSQGSLQG